MMGARASWLLTAFTTAMAAVVLIVLPYEAGLFPGGLFEDASVGPVLVWIGCLALSAGLAFVCARTLILLQSSRQSSWD